MERPEGEYPTQGWLGYGDGATTLYLCNRGLPGANVTDGVMLLTLLRSVAMEYKGPSSGAYEDGVRHSFSYSIIPADRTHPVEPWSETEALNSPPLALAAADVRPAFEPRVRLAPGNVVLSALYRDGDALTARLYETGGMACEAQFWMAGLKGCRETDAVTLTGVRLPFSPFQIRTLRLDVPRSVRR
jgi:hypothetical protein